MAFNAAHTQVVSNLECIVQVQAIVGYKFTNVLYLWEALQGTGSGVIMVDGRPLHRANERMAVVGDSALQTALVSMWFETGQHSVHWRQWWHDRYLTNVNLAAVCRRLALWKHRQNDPANPNPKCAPWAYATLLEAIAGAIFLDAGGDLEAVRTFVRDIHLVC